MRVLRADYILMYEDSTSAYFELIGNSVDGFQQQLIISKNKGFGKTKISLREINSEGLEKHLTSLFPFKIKSFDNERVYIGDLIHKAKENIRVHLIIYSEVDVIRVFKYETEFKVKRLSSQVINQIVFKNGRLS